jgi:hypothetical protein
MLYFFIPFMSQNSQSFSCSLSQASLKSTAQCGSLDHLADVVDTIGCRTFVDDHTHMLKVLVPTKQPRGAGEKWGLAISQHQEQCPQSPREVDSTLAMELCRHNISTWWHANVLPHCQLSHHLDKRR